MNTQLKKTSAEALDAMPVAARVAALDWCNLSAQLDGFGNAVIEGLLTPEECRGIADLYPHEEHFRSHIHMARHGFGKGEYRYFKYPLPNLIGDLRAVLYPRLANVAISVAHYRSPGAPWSRLVVFVIATVRTRWVWSVSTVSSTTGPVVACALSIVHCTSTRRWAGVSTSAGWAYTSDR